MTAATGAARPETAVRRVLLVRQWDEQTSSSGCCGRAGDVTTESPRDHESGHARACMEATGAAYRSLRAALPAADVVIVDPRNWAWLVPAVMRDARQRGLSRVDAVRQAVRATTPGALVVDGVVVRTRLPAPDEALRAVRAESDGGRGPVRSGQEARSAQETR